jgi:hypothetical protein
MKHDDKNRFREFCRNQLAQFLKDDTPTGLADFWTLHEGGSSLPWAMIALDLYPTGVVNWHQCQDIHDHLDINSPPQLYFYEDSEFRRPA